MPLNRVLKISCPASLVILGRKVGLQTWEQEFLQDPEQTQNQGQPLPSRNLQLSTVVEFLQWRLLQRQATELLQLQLLSLRQYFPCAAGLREQLRQLE